MPNKSDSPEISCQAFPPKISARGIWAVVPIALAVSFLLVSYGLKVVWFP